MVVAQETDPTSHSLRSGTESKVRQYSTQRRWLLRLGAVTFGLLLVVFVECVLRLLGIGRPLDIGDPFVGFSSVVRLFELNEPGTRYEIPAARQVFFRPESFPAEKSEDDFRIFVLGGSTVQGRPYAIETSFTTWLELTLKAADPDSDWDVINCGGISYASYRLIPILQETISYDPDMFIVYSGHNEFLEDRTYQSVKRRPAWLKGLQEFAWRFHLFGLLVS